MTRATFDDFAARFTAWTETAHPKRYEVLLGDLVPPVVERALDVGCGAGGLTRWLAARAAHVIGLDVSPAMLDIARRRRDAEALPNADFVLGDAEEPPFGAGSFDLVASDASIHDTDLSRTLPALRRVVRPGGLLLLRDVVTADRERERSVAHQLAGVVGRIPGYLRRLGPSATLRVLRFEASPTWLAHRAAGEALTPDEFTQAYSAHLPGCRISRQGWSMIAAWTAPGDVRQLQ